MTATDRQPTRMVSSPAKSGPSPDFLANQRSRHGVSSAAAPIRQPSPSPATDAAPSALDSTCAAPLPDRSYTRGAQTCPLLTARVVAELLDVCSETVLRWIRNGELPAIRLPGGAVRITEPELRDWLRSRATPARGVLATTTDAADCERYPEG